MMKLKHYHFNLLIFLCIFLSSCLYKNMTPSGGYKIASREKITDSYKFRLIKMPKPEDPKLLIEFDRFPVFKENRVIKENGYKKDLTMALVYSAMTFGGIMMTKTAFDRKDARGDTAFVMSESLLSGGGALIALFSGMAAINELMKPWVPITRYRNQIMKIKDEVNAYTPIPNANINIELKSLEKQWEFKTDKNGCVSLDISEITEFDKVKNNLDFSFKSEPFSVAQNFSIPRTFFSDLKAYYASIRPPKLKINCTYDDSKSWVTNKAIDGGEKSNIIVNIENVGEGIALNVKLETKCNYTGIVYDKLISIGNILPKNKIEKKIELNAPISISDGIANFSIQAKEKRGFHSRPLNMQISVRHLDKPKFEIATVDINDADVGQAMGNGNGIPENGETVEILAYIKNVGVGKAINSKLQLQLLSSGLETVSGFDNLGTILPGQTQKGKVVFKIPETFSDKKIDYQLKVNEKLGAHSLTKTYNVTTAINVPVLAYKLITPGIVHNGESYSLEIQPQNIGLLDAKNVQLRVTSISNISLSNNYLSLGMIKKGESLPLQKINFFIPRYFQSSSIPFKIEMMQSKFQGIKKTEILKLETISPQLTIHDKVFDQNQSGKIEQGETIDLEISVENQGKLEAKNVRMILNTNSNMLQSSFPKVAAIGTIPPRSRQTQKFTFTIPSGLPAGQLIFSAELSQLDFGSIQKQLRYQVFEQAAITQIIKGEASKKAKSFVGMTNGQNTKPEIFFDNYQQIVTQPNFTPDISILDDQSLNHIKITLNGRIQRALNPGNRRYTFQENIFLNSGENTLKIFAVDNNNLTSEKSFSVTYRPESSAFAGITLDPYNIEIENIPQRNVDGSDILAIIIGIENYQSNKISSVRFSKRDAYVVSEYLKKFYGLPDGNIKILLDDAATQSKLNIYFGRWLRNEIKAKGNIKKIFIYYAGHGMAEVNDGQNYLIPWDGEPAYISDTGIPVNKLLKSLSKLNQQCFVLLDACFTGQTGRGDGIQLIAEGTRRVSIAMDNIAPDNTIVFSAAQKDEPSSSLKDKKHGLFTYYFLNALKQYKLTMGEIELYVNREVSKAAGKINRKQTPQLRGDYNPNDIFLK